jgi:hypothetical protein
MRIDPLLETKESLIGVVIDINRLNEHVLQEESGIRQAAIKAKDYSYEYILNDSNKRSLMFLKQTVFKVENALKEMESPVSPDYGSNSILKSSVDSSKDIGQSIENVTKLESSFLKECMNYVSLAVSDLEASNAPKLKKSKSAKSFNKTKESFKRMKFDMDYGKPRNYTVADAGALKSSLRNVNSLKKTLKKNYKKVIQNSKSVYKGSLKIRTRNEETFLMNQKYSMFLIESFSTFTSINLFLANIENEIKRVLSELSN